MLFAVGGRQISVLSVNADPSVKAVSCVQGSNALQSYRDTSRQP